MATTTEPLGSPDTSSSLDKALSVIEVLASAPGGSGVSQIASRLKLPKSTVHRLLGSLVRRGWVVQRDDTRYELTLRLFEVGTAAYGANRMRWIAIPYLSWLRQESRAATCLALQDGDDIIMMEYLPCDPRLRGRLGGRWPLHTTAVGKVFLAYSDPQVVERYCSRGLAKLTGHSIASSSMLLEQLAEVRRTGYAVAAEEATLGVFGVSSGIFDAHRNLLAAVSIASLGHDALDHVSQVRHCGTQISLALQGRLVPMGS